MNKKCACGSVGCPFCKGKGNLRAIADTAVTVTPRNAKGSKPVTERNVEPVSVTERNDSIECDCGCGTMLARRPQYVDTSHRMKAKRTRDAENPSP